MLDNGLSAGSRSTVFCAYSFNPNAVSELVCVIFLLVFFRYILNLQWQQLSLSQATPRKFDVALDISCP